MFSGNERTLSPGGVGVCNLKVASFNVEYYIANSSLWGKGYGADNQVEFDRQRAKLLAALKGLDADILCSLRSGTRKYLFNRFGEWIKRSYFIKQLCLCGR